MNILFKTTKFSDDGENTNLNILRKNFLFDISYKYLCLLSILFTVLVLFSIFFYITINGLEVFSKVSLSNFFGSSNWDPQNNNFGSLGLVLGTFELTILSLLISLPFSISLAIFLGEMAPKWLKIIANLVLDILVGVPSIVYGYLGIIILVPYLRKISHSDTGNGLLAASIILAIMILPTITQISYNAIKSVPIHHKNAAYALGANHSQVIRKIILPGARDGILSAIILGIVRSIGETMAVVMVIGNTPRLAKDLFSPTSVLTSNIVMQITNVATNSVWSHALYMQAFLLLLTSLLFILVLRAFRGKKI